MVFGQPAGLSKEVCLYAGADWLNPEVGERSRASSRCQGHHDRWPVNTTSDSKALSHKCKTHSRTNAYYFNLHGRIVQLDNDELLWSRRKRALNKTLLFVTGFLSFFLNKGYYCLPLNENNVVRSKWPYSPAG